MKNADRHRNEPHRHRDLAHRQPEASRWRGARRTRPSDRRRERRRARRARVHRASADPIGTDAAAATLKGAVKTAGEHAQGRRSPTVFLDKLGERLAFERTGTRLYEPLIAKFERGRARPTVAPRAPSSSDIQRRGAATTSMLVRDA